MKKRPHKKTCYFRIFLIIVLLILIFLTITFYYMQPIIMNYAVSVAETTMLYAANQAIIDILAEESLSYEDIVSLTDNEEGYVRSLEINIYKINSLKSKISHKTSDIVSKGEEYQVKIPIGSFFGSTVTNGWGPKIKFKMHITTTAFVDFEHEFKDAGINQVLHIINVKINIRGNFVMLGYSNTVSTSTKAIAAQTVIVGKSPDAYTNVIENEDDNTAGLINDYGY